MEGLQEVVAEETPETDFQEIQVEDEQVPVVESEPEGGGDPVKTEAPLKEEAPVVDPKIAEELERERKDKAAIAYNLRESQRQQRFLEEQLRQEREKIQRAAMRSEHDAELSKIEHLREIDPDAYIRERERLLEARYRKELEQEREAIKTRVVSEEASERRRRVEERIERDFPELKNQGSVLFAEVRSALESQYSAEEAAYILAHTPQVMYNIVEATSARLRLKQLESERANEGREKRVAGQGAIEATKKPTATTTLTKQQVEFCKKNDLDPKEYAKYLAKARR